MLRNWNEQIGVVEMLMKLYEREADAGMRNALAGTTAKTGGMNTVGLETLKQAMTEIDLLPKPDQWTVIDPQGRIYKGKVEEVTRILLAEHPLLKMPKNALVRDGTPDPLRELVPKT